MVNMEKYTISLLEDMDVQDIAQCPGCGLRVAKRVKDFCQAYDIRSWNDLLVISGVGRRKLEQLKVCAAQQTTKQR